MTGWYFTMFNFTAESPTQKEALLWIKDFIFHPQLKEAMPKVVCVYHQPMKKLKEVVHCLKVESDDIDEDDPRCIQIKETKADRVVDGKVEEMVASDYGRVIKTKKHNIGTKEAPKIHIIGDYWDKETITHVVDLIKEYEYLFPRSFSKMKGIIGSLGAMKLQFTLDAKSVKRRPYHLNPKYKEKVCKDLDRMLDARIIVPMEDLDWISPMMVQPKNTCDI
jgi:hypothetical protein